MSCALDRLLTYWYTQYLILPSTISLPFFLYLFFQIPPPFQPLQNAISILRTLPDHPSHQPLLIIAGKPHTCPQHTYFIPTNCLIHSISHPSPSSAMLIDGEKYACEACVRGHRVSTCQHSGKLSSSYSPTEGLAGARADSGLRPPTYTYQQERPSCLAMHTLQRSPQGSRLTCTMRVRSKTTQQGRVQR